MPKSGDIGERILIEDFGSLQDLIDYLAELLSSRTGKTEHVSVFSQIEPDYSYLGLICSTDKSSKKFADPIDLSRPNTIHVRSKILNDTILTFESTTELAGMESYIGAAANIILYEKRRRIRSKIASAANNSRDVNSFIFRCLESIRKEILYCEEVSVFLHDEVLQRLVLSASTESLVKPKDHYFFLLSENTPPAIAFREANEIYLYFDGADLPWLHGDTARRPNFFGIDDKTKSLVIWPIVFSHSDDPEENGKTGSAVGGLIFLQGIFRKHGTTSWRSFLTKYDRAQVTFLTELLYISVRQFIRGHKSEHDFAKLTHATNTAMISTESRLRKLKNQLFEQVVDESGETITNFRFNLTEDANDQLSRLQKHAEARGIRPPKLAPVVDRDTILLEFLNLEATLADMNFQFEKVVGHNDSNLIVKPVKILADVLMPTLLAYQASDPYTGAPPPKFNHFKSAGFDKAPDVYGNSEALKSVFRNLVENAVKYKRGDFAEITISCECAADELLISVADDGIGIPNGDHEVIFNEGYRGVQAMKLDNKGIGHGLSYCRDVLNTMGGTIKSMPSESGALFKISLRTT